MTYLVEMAKKETFNLRIHFKVTKANGIHVTAPVTPVCLYGSLQD